MLTRSIYSNNHTNSVTNTSGLAKNITTGLRIVFWFQGVKSTWVWAIFFWLNLIWTHNIYWSKVGPTFKLGLYGTALTQSHPTLKFFQSTLMLSFWNYNFFCQVFVQSQFLQHYQVDQSKENCQVHVKVVKKLSVSKNGYAQVLTLRNLEYPVKGAQLLVQI